MIRIWIWIINVRLLGQCSRSGGIVASLIAAIPHCQTQPIELVYFALAESTSTQRSPRQGRKKKSAGSDGNHLENTDQNVHLLLPAIHVSHEDFFQTVSKRINKNRRDN